MNCEQLHEKLFDYLDGSFPPSEQAAAERHLAGCPACREAVQRGSQLAQSLSRQLEQAGDTVVLDPAAQRRLAGAVKRQFAESRERPPVWFWNRLALPFAATVAVLLVALWMEHHFRPGHHPPLEAAHLPALADNHKVVINLSCSVPTYTFRREGNQVIDALTSDTVVADGSLPLEDGESQINRHEL